MKLYILEGCHASGKTTILEKLRCKNNIFIKNENYFNLTRFKHGTVLHQCDWLLNWLNDILLIKKEGKEKVICDRGPITSIIYGGEQYQFIVDEIYNVLKQNNILIIKLILKSPQLHEHKKRIIDRNGPFAELELKNLEEVKEKYNKLCKNYVEISDINQLNGIIEQ